MSQHQGTDHAVDPQRVIEEARAAIDDYRRVMAEAGLTPQSCIERLRRVEGDAAVQQVQQQAAQVIRQFEEQTARDVFHASPARRPLFRRVAGRRIV